MVRGGKATNIQQIATPRGQKDPYAPSQFNVSNPYPQQDAVQGGSGGLNARSDGTGLDRRYDDPEKFGNNTGPVGANNVVSVGNIDLAGGDFRPTGQSLSSRAVDWTLASALVLALLVVTFIVKPSFDVPYKYHILAVLGLAWLWVANNKSRNSDDSTQSYINSVLLYYLLLFALLMGLSGLEFDFEGENTYMYLLGAVVVVLIWTRTLIVPNVLDPWSVVNQTWTDTTPRLP